MNFDIEFALEIVPRVLQGIENTIIVSAVSFVGATALGFFWEMLRRSHWLMRAIAQFIIDAIRSTPALVQVYFLFFVLPYYGVKLPAMFVGIFGLSFYFSGYISEVFKAGIDTIPAGQSQAAQSLGLGRVDTVIFVIAPQMLRNVAAPLGSYSVYILLSTPLLALLGVPEMLGSALDVASEAYRFAEPTFVSGVLFLILNLIVVAGVALFERRLGLRTQPH